MTPAVPAVETFGDLAFGDIFLHLLTGTLALLADEFAVEDFCSGLFDGFLLTAAPRYLGGRTGAGWAGGGGGARPAAPVASSRKENVQRHALRLLLHLHHRVAPAKLQALQKALEPTGQVGARARTCRPLPVSVGRSEWPWGLSSPTTGFPHRAERP